MAIDARSRLGISEEELAEFCRKWKIVRLDLFGSALRDDFSDASDIDLLYVFERNAGWSLLDVLSAEQELASISGRRVELVSRYAIEHSKNWMRRKEILGTSRVLYPIG